MAWVWAVDCWLGDYIYISHIYTYRYIDYEILHMFLFLQFVGPDQLKMILDALMYPKCYDKHYFKSYKQIKNDEVLSFLKKISYIPF